MTSNIEPEVSDHQQQYEARKLYTLPIKKLHPDPNQPRKYFDENALKELSINIKKLGVLSPILFRQDQDGKLIIVAGERRYQASKLAKIDSIPALFSDGNPAEIALVENILRENLTPLEEAEGLKRLQDDENYSNKDLMSVIGKAESTISEILSLNKLPDEIKNEIRSNKEYSRRQLVEVAKGNGPEEMNKLFRTLKKKNSSRDQVRGQRQRDVEAVFMTLIKGLSTKLNEVNLNELDEGKRSKIRSELSTLSDLILQKTT